MEAASVSRGAFSSPAKHVTLMFSDKAKLINQHGAWLERIENGYFEDSDVEDLKKILSEVQG